MKISIKFLLVATCTSVVGLSGFARIARAAVVHSLTRQPTAHQTIAKASDGDGETNDDGAKGRQVGDGDGETNDDDRHSSAQSSDRSSHPRNSSGISHHSSHQTHVGKSHH